MGTDDMRLMREWVLGEDNWHGHDGVHTMRLDCASPGVDYWVWMLVECDGSVYIYLTNSDSTQAIAPADDFPTVADARATVADYMDMVMDPDGDWALGFPFN